MASSKVMPSSTSRNSDLSSSSRRPSSSSKSNRTKSHNTAVAAAAPAAAIDNNSSSTMTVDGFLRTVYDSNPSADSTLVDAQIALIDNPITMPTTNVPYATPETISRPKTVDDVWREIVSGDRKACKEEVPDEMMTLEDFLVKAGAVEEDEDVKMPLTERVSGGIFSFDPISPSPFQALDNVEGSIIGFGHGLEVIGGDAGGGNGGSIGKGKRGRAVLEPMDKAAQQRQRRMIKNRESAARSRERKQAYQVELESLAVKLEEENKLLRKEKEERTKERFKQLMKKRVPVVEKRRPQRVLRRVNSLEW